MFNYNYIKSVLKDKTILECTKNITNIIKFRNIVNLASKTTCSYYINMKSINYNLKRDMVDILAPSIINYYDVSNVSQKETLKKAVYNKIECIILYLDNYFFCYELLDITSNTNSLISFYDNINKTNNISEDCYICCIDTSMEGISSVICEECNTPTCYNCVKNVDNCPFCRSSYNNIEFVIK